LINGIFAGKTGRREEKVACGANRHGGHVPYNLKPGNEELYADARESCSIQNRLREILRRKSSILVMEMMQEVEQVQFQRASKYDLSRSWSASADIDKLVTTDTRIKFHVSVATNREHSCRENATVFLS
jgi:hypothetical protein